MNDLCEKLGRRYYINTGAMSFDIKNGWSKRFIINMNSMNYEPSLWYYIYDYKD